MSMLDVVVLIPESTRKARGGVQAPFSQDSVSQALGPDARRKLGSLRAEVRAKAPKDSMDFSSVMPAYLRFQGNMFRHIPRNAWEARKEGVEVLIVSGLRGLVASRDPVPWYRLSMAEPTEPFGRLNRWWHDRGLPEILAAYLEAIRPKQVVDLLSLEYREAVSGYSEGLRGIPVKTVDFPGLGRASQPRRGERVAELLRTGRV